MGENGQSARAKRRLEAIDSDYSGKVSLAEKILFFTVAAMFTLSVAGIAVVRSANADSAALVDMPSLLELDMSVINSATKEDLMEVKGIGDARSDAIINLRDAIGGFIDIREIANIDGISDTIIKALIEYFYGSEAAEIYFGELK
ncbi:MAG TPA: helix-hairpin-helix domain-containing protein [Candidatus Faeciplasma gallinarum]|uniref:Helix-hairpin-helix domain-containing protein n=1 Tax=Candidatus Faeciplasma gallinarum TaxID=2840799 RepID=A0A9D1ENF0_9FIRM|nr:helix-hairpin-helix domain-containing protein [Candidatus Faeciplasma gallinarum]